ncbi:alpha/beta hydrolase fold domain-containing protein [Pseudoroseicyclus aestuarii]|uniref:Acetyl esterase/lipase n=1 Tax=Pseudoroseicyclus aestuarii TaxID=1795041 RepID=A0A318T6Z7_9RHOB|nr:alpha/beta hydrolase fold domain-containing protein [Pseudoroseicyclus aestuarii]PYE86254.1 acetyl esterase/lipase [Pseudoroseicyclus aestuarii]
MEAMRAYLKLQPEMALTPEGRADYDAFIGSVPTADGVMFEEAQIAGVDGWWCRPADARPEGAIVYIHGGAFTLGSAGSYRNFASHLARAAAAVTFVPNYALAPEAPYPAALTDIRSVLRGLRASGVERVGLIGDSAGGGLALAIAQAPDPGPKAGFPVIGAVVSMSPWTDLSLAAPGIAERTAADPILSRAQLLTAASLYAGHVQDPRESELSPCFAPKDKMPPTMFHVGTDEILLDDALAYKGVAEVHVWDGMTHVFPASLQSLEAARDAIALMGDFLTTRLGREA